MSFADAVNFKIPNGNGGFNSYPIKDIKNERTRRDISSDLANLTTAIAEKNLKKYGYAIGDYFLGPVAHDGNKYVYTLADENTFKGGDGYSSLTYAVIPDNHITIVVDTKQNVKWNNSDSTTTGYNGSNLHSYMVNTVLPNVKSDLTTLFGDWSSHLIKHQKLLTTATSSWGWQADQYISALTSVQLHGSPICDIDFYSTGEGNKPLEVFQKYFYAEVLGNHNTWLRSVASASCPCYARNDGGAAGHAGASHSNGAVGLIIFH